MNVIDLLVALKMSKFVRSKKGLKILTDNSYKAIEEGAYDVEKYSQKLHDVLSLKKSILSCDHAPIIAELKFASPSKGLLRGPNMQVTELAHLILNSGVVGLSILTQPYLFNGSIEYILDIRKIAAVPILMKDIIVSETQIHAAKQIGADCILLIKSIFDEGLAEGSLEKLYEYASRAGLQVLLEVHSEDEFSEILENSVKQRQRLLIGINNRDLNTLETDIGTTIKLLDKYKKGKNLIVSESGINEPKDIQLLRKYGADAFLIGTTIMESNDIPSKIKQLYFSI